MSRRLSRTFIPHVSELVSQFQANRSEIGLLQHFTPAPEMNYLKPKQFVREGKPLRLINVGALASSWHNVFSGLRESPADMLTYGYSLIDLLGTPVRPTTFASTSVYGFLRCALT